MTTDIMLLSPPPRDVQFSSLEAMLQWYTEHPERVAIIHNVEVPETEAEGTVA